MTEERITGTAVTIPVLDESTFESLREKVRGEMLRIGDDGYESARRVWNGMIDRRPQLIVRCTGAADVVACVKVAREHGLPLSVRGGGHNVSGNAVCDGGLVVDLSRMRGVRVEPDRSVVHVAAGAKLGDVDHETQVFGLAVPMGVMSATGVAGLSLHGGLGLLTRKHGTTSDNLLAAEVVTAEGRLLAVDEHHHPDLLWALRGGGGNFGVVTSFTFRVHPVGPDVFFVLAFYPLEKAQKVLGFLREFMAGAPDELMAIAIYWSAPEDEPIPEEHRGAPVIVLAACWSGSVEEGERVTKPMREVDVPIADLSGPMPFLAAQKIFDPEYPDGRHYYWKSIYLDDLNPAVIDLLSDYAARRPSHLSSIDLWVLGGAFGRVNPQATAFFQRKAPYLLGIEANWDGAESDAANVAWVRELFSAAEPFSSGGAYYNFPGFLEEGDALLRQSYGRNYERLREVKAKYDPQDFFRYNLRIPVRAREAGAGPGAAISARPAAGPPAP